MRLVGIGSTSYDLSSNTPIPSRETYLLPHDARPSAHNSRKKTLSERDIAHIGWEIKHGIPVSATNDQTIASALC